MMIVKKLVIFTCWTGAQARSDGAVSPIEGAEISAPDDDNGNQAGCVDRASVSCGSCVTSCLGRFQNNVVVDTVSEGCEMVTKEATKLENQINTLVVDHSDQNEFEIELAITDTLSGTLGEIPTDENETSQKGKLDVKSFYTVKKVKQMLETRPMKKLEPEMIQVPSWYRDILGMSWENQTFYVRNADRSVTELDNNRTLRHYDIRAGAEIQVMLGISETTEALKDLFNKHGDGTIFNVGDTVVAKVGKLEIPGIITGARDVTNTCWIVTDPLTSNLQKTSSLRKKTKRASIWIDPKAANVVTHSLKFDDVKDELVRVMKAESEKLRPSGITFWDTTPADSKTHERELYFWKRGVNQFDIKLSQVNVQPAFVVGDTVNLRQNEYLDCKVISFNIEDYASCDAPINCDAAESCKPMIKSDISHDGEHSDFDQDKFCIVEVKAWAHDLNALTVVDVCSMQPLEMKERFKFNAKDLLHDTVYVDTTGLIRHVDVNRKGPEVVKGIASKQYFFNVPIKMNQLEKQQHKITVDQQGFITSGRSEPMMFDQPGGGKFEVVLRSGMKILSINDRRFTKTEFQALKSSTKNSLYDVVRGVPELKSEESLTFEIGESHPESREGCEKAPLQFHDKRFFKITQITAENRSIRKWKGKIISPKWDIWKDNFDKDKNDGEERNANVADLNDVLQYAFGLNHDRPLPDNYTITVEATKVHAVLKVKQADLRKREWLAGDGVYVPKDIAVRQRSKKHGAKKSESELYGNGQLHMRFHGDPTEDHIFFEYPPNIKLKTPRFETYNAHAFCNNKKDLGPRGEIHVWQCLGHGPRKKLFCGECDGKNQDPITVPILQQAIEHKKFEGVTVDAKTGKLKISGHCTEQLPEGFANGSIIKWVHGSASKSKESKPFRDLFLQNRPSSCSLEDMRRGSCNFEVSASTKTVGDIFNDDAFQGDDYIKFDIAPRKIMKYHEQVRMKKDFITVGKNREDVMEKCDNCTIPFQLGEAHFVHCFGECKYYLCSKCAFQGCGHPHGLHGFHGDPNNDYEFTSPEGVFADEYCNNHEVRTKVVDGKEVKTYHCLGHDLDFTSEPFEHVLPKSSRRSSKTVHDVQYSSLRSETGTCPVKTLTRAGTQHWKDKIADSAQESSLEKKFMKSKSHGSGTLFPPQKLQTTRLRKNRSSHERDEDVVQDFMIKLRLPYGRLEGKTVRMDVKWTDIVADVKGRLQDEIQTQWDKEDVSLAERGLERNRGNKNFSSSHQVFIFKNEVLDDSMALGSYGIGLDDVIGIKYPESPGAGPITKRFHGVPNGKGQFIFRERRKGRKNISTNYGEARKYKVGDKVFFKKEYDNKEIPAVVRDVIKEFEDSEITDYEIQLEDGTETEFQAKIDKLRPVPKSDTTNDQWTTDDARNMCNNCTQTKPESDGYRYYICHGHNVTARRLEDSAFVRGATVKMKGFTDEYAKLNGVIAELVISEADFYKIKGQPSVEQEGPSEWILELSERFFPEYRDNDDQEFDTFTKELEDQELGFVKYEISKNKFGFRGSFEDNYFTRWRKGDDANLDPTAVIGIENEWIRIKKDEFKSGDVKFDSNGIIRYVKPEFEFDGLRNGMKILSINDHKFADKFDDESDEGEFDLHAAIDLFKHSWDTDEFELELAALESEMDHDRKFDIDSRVHTENWDLKEENKLENIWELKDLKYPVVHCEVKGQGQAVLLIDDNYYLKLSAWNGDHSIDFVVRQDSLADVERPFTIYDNQVSKGDKVQLKHREYLECEVLEVHKTDQDGEEEDTMLTVKYTGPRFDFEQAYVPLSEIAWYSDEEFKMSEVEVIIRAKKSDVIIIPLVTRTVRSNKGCPANKELGIKFRDDPKFGDDEQEAIIESLGKWAGEKTNWKEITRPNLEKFIGWRIIELNSEKINMKSDFKKKLSGLHADEAISFKLEHVAQKHIDCPTNSVKVDVSDDVGTTLRVLYEVARQCDNIGMGNYSRGKKIYNMHMEAWKAFYPMILQVITLVLLATIESEDEETGSGTFNENVTFEFSIDEDPDAHPVFIIASLVIFVYDVFTFFTGPSLRCLYCFKRIPYWKHPAPVWSKIICGVLFFLDWAIGMGTFALGFRFLIFSESKADLLLNAVALHFILDIDDMILKLTPNVGAVTHLNVPSNVIMPETTSELLKGDSYDWFFISYLVDTGFVKVPWFPLWISLCAFYVFHHWPYVQHFNIAFVSLILAPLLLFFSIYIIFPSKLPFFHSKGFKQIGWEARNKDPLRVRMWEWMSSCCCGRPDPKDNNDKKDSSERTSESRSITGLTWIPGDSKADGDSNKDPKRESFGVRMVFGETGTI